MEQFVEISLILALVAAVSMLARLLKQPLIVGYILAGVIAGPYGLGLIQSVEPIELFSKIGISVLLFIVGLSLSPKIIKDVGKVSLITGLGQVVFTSLIGFGIARFLGMSTIAALYVSIALTFSSTIIILKLLTDRGDLNTLYGKIAIGFLLVQDIVATLILLFVSASASSSEAVWVNIALMFGKATFVFLTLALLGKWVLPHLLKFVAKSTELLFVFALAWGLGMGSLFYFLGFSLEIGTLVAGVALSMTPYAVEMSARMKPLRDFFIILFFVLLGSHMVLETITLIIGPAVILSLFVLVGNPVIVIVLMNLLGYRSRTGFMAGLTVAQISEFSLILATLGFNLGHLPKETLSLVTLVGLVTIAGSAYMIQYADTLYLKLEKVLKFLELRHRIKVRAIVDEKFDGIVIGYGRVGEDYRRIIESMKLKTLVVDHNPDAIERLKQAEIPYRYGDLAEPEFLEELPFEGSRVVVASLTDHTVNLGLVRYIKSISKTLVIVTANQAKEAQELYSEGADYVIVPHYLGARYGVSILKKITREKELLKAEREKHLRFLESREI
ncbi:MAG: cation:proton antiporter [Candidatus Microgenomates bacterium]